MARLVLGVLAVGSGLMSMAFILEMVWLDSRPNATVFQQIAARMSAGLSLLVFAVSYGVLTLLAAARKRHEEMLKLLRPPSVSGENRA